MAFTVTTQKCSVRREKLRRAQTLLNELININEAADRTRTQLLANGVSAGETETTVNKVLAAAGPPFVSAATDITPTGNTLADELILLLSTSTNGTGWEYLAET